MRFPLKTTDYLIVVVVVVVVVLTLLLLFQEFESGCEATCNGPYAGAWSKTMVGLGPEDKNFVFELTYNYGIEGYKFGNDLQYIGLLSKGAAERAQKAGYEVGDVVGGGEDEKIIKGPDSYSFRVGDSEPASLDDSVVCVGVRVSNLEKAKDFYAGVLGMKEYNNVPLTSSPHPNVVLGYGDAQTKLQLIQVGDGKEVDHALSSGRIAFATREGVKQIFDKVTSSGDIVLTPPLTLPTPGKADVVVSILADRDGYEICFVEDVGFYELATPTYDVIDWEARGKKGGDGNPLPSSPPIAHSGEKMTHLEGEKGIETVRGGEGVAVVDWSAGWCKNCKRIAPEVEALAEKMEGVRFYTMDVDESDDVAEELGVVAVPAFVFFKNGKKVGAYAGSNIGALSSKIEALK